MMREKRSCPKHGTGDRTIKNLEVILDTLMETLSARYKHTIIKILI